GFFLGSTYTTIDDPFASVAGHTQDYTIAWGVNDAGVIVGEFSAFIGYTAAFVDIPDPGGGGSTFFTLDINSRQVIAHGINDMNLVVGYYQDPTTFRTHGFLFKPTEVIFGINSQLVGVYTTLDDPAGTDTEAYGINDAGQIVGTYSSFHDGLLHSF